MVKVHTWQHVVSCHGDCQSLQSQPITVGDCHIKAGVKHLSDTSLPEAGSFLCVLHFRFRAVTGRLPAGAAFLPYVAHPMLILVIV